ncbi:MAG: hypothetical protein EXR95_02445 [Gemmatimonadetes bacterium]|nr:hypothetical protein [Gemmatimonadota bacterium]
MSRAPTWMPPIPSASSMCGGDSTFTSSPYALCHQSSNGADVIIVSVPQIATHAPSGPTKPQKRTPSSSSSRRPANVVRSTSQPHPSPAITAAACSSRCGGDQNVSRPIVRCQEMSHMSPTVIESAATSSA